MIKQKFREIQLRRKQNEDGFTLLELLIAVIVIGILIAVVIPLFSAQQKTTMEASLKADMRQAAMIMHTESAKSAGRYGTYIPNYATQSINNQVELDRTRSSPYVFCLTGVNSKIPGVTYYYNSNNGKISTTPCTVVNPANGDGNSFTSTQAAILAVKKAVIVYHPNASFDGGVSKVRLQELGYGQVDVMNESTFSAATNISSYDFVYLNYKYWGAWSGIVNKAYTAYQAGKLVYVDGNDFGAGEITQFIAADTLIPASSGQINPTYKQGLNPSFPYTFPAAAFTWDSWSCITSLKNGAIDMANSANPVNPGTPCITMFAATNGNGGRWAYVSVSENTSIRSAVWQWLLK